MMSFHSDPDNRIADHFIATCPKKLAAKLRRQIREKWQEVRCSIPVQAFGDGDIPSKTAAGITMALDCLIFNTVLNLTNDGGIMEMFKLLDMTIVEADLFVLPDPDSDGPFVGIGLQLESEECSIMIRPLIGPHFASSWAAGMPKSQPLPNVGKIVKKAGAGIAASKTNQAKGKKPRKG